MKNAYTFRRVKLFNAFLFLIVASLIIWQFSRPIKAYFFQQQAISLINKEFGDNFYGIACLAASEYEITEKLAVKQALDLLLKAKKVYPQNTQVYLWVGRAYCMLGNFEDAIFALDEYTQKRPKNPYGYIELGYAVIQKLRDPDFNKDQNYNGLFKQLEKSIKHGNFYPEILLADANIFFQSREYSLAILNYQLSEIIEPLPFELKTRLSLLELAAGLSLEILPNSITVFLYENSLDISPRDLINLRNLNPISIRTIDEKLTGILFSNFDEAFIIINIQTPGNYCLHIQALDLPPKPTLIGVNVNLAQVHIIELPNEDAEWKDYFIEVFLNSGLNILSLNLLNDLYTNGLDRNAYLGYISILECRLQKEGD
jgi:hypothetical protein